MVDDDDGNDFPSPESRTDSRPAIPMKIRAWRRLRIVKLNESFSLIFLPECEYMELELRSVEVQGPHKPGRRALGGAPPELVAPGWPPLVYFFASIFYIFQKNYP